MQAPRGILITDFDGTIARRDFYDLVRERWPVPPDDDPWDRYVEGKLTHFEAIAKIFEGIRGSEAEVKALADSIEVCPDFAPTVRALQEAGWEVAVASAGCRWYIDYILDGAGVRVGVHANPGTLDPGRGLIMRPPPEGAFFDPSTGTDKTAIVRDALARTPVVAFAGDGRPDLEPCLLVPAERRFARGWLASKLRAMGEGFVPLQNWSAVGDALLC